MANLQIVVNGVNKASGALGQVKQQIGELSGAGKDAGKGVAGLGASLTSIMGIAATAAAGIASVSLAFKQVIDLSREGAALDYAAGKFERLAVAIGSTSDVLLSDMKLATSGLMSDAQLMSGAGDMMALGLAKTSDEAIRLTRVVAQLNMPMNDLVLTLTNQTVRRFDTLGVSIDGFDAKLEKLKATGMSAGDAFKTAFLEQAEAQISKVGDVADTTLGKWKAMDAAQSNYFDNLKLSLAESTTWWADFWTDFYAGKNQARDYNESIDTIVRAGLGNELAAETGLPLWSLADSKFLKENPQIIQGFMDRAAAIEANNNAQSRYYLGAQAITEEAENYNAIMAESAGITTFTANLKGIVSTASAMSEILQSITELESQLANPDLGAEEYDEIVDKIAATKDAMTALSNQIVFDMAAAKVALGDVTTQEMTGLLDFGVQLGLISRKGADASLAAWTDAFGEVNGLTIDPKTGEVIFDINTAAVDEYMPADKFGVVYYSANDSGRIAQAVGGSVTAGQPYNWQEYGYRGEVFVPSADGFVLSRADAERALAGALYGSGNAVDSKSIGDAVAGAVGKALGGVKQGGGAVYNLTANYPQESAVKLSDQLRIFAMLEGRRA